MNEQEKQQLEREFAESINKLSLSKTTNNSDMKTEWISVKNRYPKDYERVLLYDSRDTYPNAVHAGYLVASQSRPDYITHWMPLPEPPKQ